MRRKAAAKEDPKKKAGGRGVPVGENEGGVVKTPTRKKARICKRSTELQNATRACPGRRQYVC